MICPIRKTINFYKFKSDRPKTLSKLAKYLGIPKRKIWEAMSFSPQYSRLIERYLEREIERHDRNTV